MNTTRRLHDRALELAAIALDFGLAAPEDAELAGHLATCSACARTATDLRGDAALLRHAPAPLPSRRVDDAVAAAIAGRSPRTSPQRLLLLVAAAALLLVALLGVAAAGSFILRTWPTIPTVVLPSPSAPAVVVDPTPSPPPAWQSATIPPMFAGGLSTPVAVAAGPTELAAVGGRTFQDLEGPSGGTGGAWRSTDGAAWEPATSIAELAVGDMIPTSGPEAGLVDVAWGPGGFVAVGIALEPDGTVGGAWHSADGLAWTRSELPEPSLARPTAVTWDGSSFVAVGAVEEPGSPRAAVWLSTNGRTWRRAPDGDAFDIGGYVDTGEHRAWFGPAEVTAAADGTLYAVGRTCDFRAGDDTGTCSPYVIRSIGGETWSSVPVPAASFSVVLASVAASSTHVVAVSGGEGEGVVVGDEAGWRQIERRGEVPLYRVVAFGKGFLALSMDSNRIALWTSLDGETWTAAPEVPQPSNVTLLRDADLVVAGGQVVIVGWTETGAAEGVGSFAIVGSTRLLDPAPEAPVESQPSLSPASPASSGG